MPIELDEGACRTTLRKVLDSEPFTGSRRLSEFLDYSGNAALSGRTSLDQYEIADKVLGRSADFHPWDDATVRKLATQVRYKLEEYYAGPGADDSIVVSLPKRSYVARFQLREGRPLQPEPKESESVVEPEPPASPEPLAVAVPASVAVEAPPRTGRSRWWALALGVVLIAGSSFYLLQRRAPSPSADAHLSQIVIQTAQGDIRGEGFDVAPDAIQTGLPVADGEEVMVRLQFSPDRPTQQAGVMAMIDADNFVRLGHHFKNRNLLEFAHESRGKFLTQSGTYEYDPAGQQGGSRWFAVRRTGDEYKGYLSSDGFSWRPFGTALTLASRSPAPRAALYAFNGRTSNPSATAVFDQFGSALAFHDREPGPWTGTTAPSWQEQSECPPAASARTWNGALEVTFAPDVRGCSWHLTAPAPRGDWAISTLLDHEAVSGSSAGVTIRGSNRSIALTRRDLDGRFIMLERSDDRDQKLPDFAGSPPVILRMEKRGDTLRASVSRDGKEWKAIGVPVPFGEIGELRSVGITARIPHWTSPGNWPVARFFWIRKEPVIPGRLIAGNVP